MDRKSAASTFREIGCLIEVAGGNPYRIRAFTGAARALETAEGDLSELVSSGAILELRGIGKGTAAVLEDLAAERRPRALIEAEGRVPPGVRAMLSLPGLGPKKVRALWRELGVESLGELEYACVENRLVDLKGFGPATQASVLDGLRFVGRAGERRLLPEGWAAAEACLAVLAGLNGVIGAGASGELRRQCETIGEVALVVTVAQGADLEAIARKMGAAEKAGGGRFVARLEGRPPMSLAFADPTRAGVVSLYSTGGDDLLAALEARAASRGMRLTRDGLFSDGVSIAGEDEAALFEALDLQWISPELREDPRRVREAADGVLPELVGLEELTGALHNHTTDSDGLASLEEMAAAARERGWAFFGVADHSPAAHYANGVDADRLRTQWRRADAWNDSHPDLRIVKGLEADILADGRLDIPPGCDDGLDYVVASVHSSFKLPREAQTERLVAAVRHPACRVLGHPTGRLLLARPGYEVDLEPVLDACAEHGVAVEINASPHRLDLDWRWAGKALERGLKLVVNPDAHSVDGLDDLRWGVAVARRAGATAADLVNCDDIEVFLQRR